MPIFTVEPASWPRDEGDIARLRRTVFIREQGVPDALEWETRDPDCDWFAARDGAGGLVGIARLVPGGMAGLPASEGIIGRMAVLPAWRRRGVGSALLLAGLAKARARGLDRVMLHAQTQALAFYARHGFLPLGPVFDEAGIPHQMMVLNLEQP